MKKMKAALMYGPGDIRYEQVERPCCPEGGFLLKVKAVGLCGSDIRNLLTDSKAGRYPHIYGHEIVGEIVEIDENVTKYQRGQIVYVYPMAHCLRCENCRNGKHECCTEAESYTDLQGGFAEYIAYSATRVERGAIFEVPEGREPIAATLAEPLSSTYACMENIQVSLGDSVVIIGAGPIGVFLEILARIRGASKVIVIDKNADRLALMEAFNVDHRIDSSKEDPVEKVKEYTNGHGAHKVISANPSIEAQQQSIFMARKCGIVVFFGGVAKNQLTPIDTNAVHYNNLWIYGHYGANSIQVEKSFHLSLSDQFPAEKIISHVLPLADINQAIELTREGKALKVVLLPEEEYKIHSLLKSQK